MKNLKHTPGPWKWGVMDLSTACLHGTSDGVFDLEGAHVLDVSPCESCQARQIADGDTEFKWGHCMTPNEANARLIAAAPELLEALKSIENDDGRIPKAIWDLRNAAIAKAEGSR